MKVLNLYAGIGGNRSLWDGVEVTAVEIDPEVAAIYQRRFPNDRLVIGDAVEYLHENMDEFDFIWASPPCVTHTQIMYLNKNVNRKSIKLPDLILYSIIIYLKAWFRGKYCIENVIPYYDYLIKPSVILERHAFWTNFYVAPKDFERIRIGYHDKNKGVNYVGDEELKIKLDVSGDLNVSSKMLRNCVNPVVAKYILGCSLKLRQVSLFQKDEL